MPTFESTAYITRFVRSLKKTASHNHITRRLSTSSSKKSDRKLSKTAFNDAERFDFQFLLLLKDDDAQRDFREFLRAAGRPEMCSYVDFAAACFGLQEMTFDSNKTESKTMKGSTGTLPGSRGNTELEVRMVNIYNTFIRPYSYDKIDFDDFGSTQERIEFDIRHNNLDPSIFRSAIWIVSRKLSYLLLAFYNK